MEIFTIIRMDFVLPDGLYSVRSLIRAAPNSAAGCRSGDEHEVPGIFLQPLIVASRQ